MILDFEEVRWKVERACAREDMLDACHRHDVPMMLRILRKYGLTQGQISSLTGIYQNRVSEYTRGVRQPTLDTLKALADGLRMPDEARRALGFAPADVGREATPAAQTATEPAVGLDMLTLAWMAGSLGDHMDRRTVLQLASTVAVTPLLGLEETAERLAYALAGPTSLQEDAVNFLEQRTVGLHRVEPMFQPRIAHRAIMSHLREITALLEGHPRDPLRSRLAKTAGETAVLAAWTAWEMREASYASRMYRAVEIAAREADDPAIIACANVYRSYATVGQHAHEESRQLLAEARQLLPEKGDNATRAWVLGREAEEAAATSDPRAKDLIKQAVEAFHQGRPQKERPWTTFLNEPRMDALQFSTYTRLGDEERVHDLADDLLSSVVPGSKRAALFNADIGIAAVRLGDVRGAITYGHRSLEAVRASETASFGLWKLEQLAKELAKEPRARDFLVEIKTVRRALASHH